MIAAAAVPLAVGLVLHLCVGVGEEPVWGPRVTSHAAGKGGGGKKGGGGTPPPPPSPPQPHDPEAQAAAAKARMAARKRKGRAATILQGEPERLGAPGEAVPAGARPSPTGGGETLG